MRPLRLPALAAPSAWAQDSTAYGADFDAMWTFVAEEYAYPERPTGRACGRCTG